MEVYEGVMMNIAVPWRRMRPRRSGRRFLISLWIPLSKEFQYPGHNAELYYPVEYFRDQGTEDLLVLLRQTTNVTTW